MFSETDDVIGRTEALKHRIQTCDAHPFKQPLRSVPFNKQNEMDELIENMLPKDVITRSKSPLANELVKNRMEANAFAD